MNDIDHLYEATQHVEADHLQRAQAHALIAIAEGLRRSNELYVLAHSKPRLPKPPVPPKDGEPGSFSYIAKSRLSSIKNGKESDGRS